MNPPIFEIASTSVAVQALLGVNPTRLYAFGEAEQGTPRPYAVWQTIGGSPFNYLGEVPDGDSFATQIDVYAKDDQQARDVAEALRAALEPVAYVTSYNGEFREPITRDYRYSFSVDWLVTR